MRIKNVLAVERRARDLLGEDSITYGTTALDQVDVRLSKVAFTPGNALVLGDLEEADFGGYAALKANGAPDKLVDPATQNGLLLLKEPAGGWLWIATGAPPANTPQTIYGAYVQFETGGMLLGACLFDEPILISAADDFVSIPTLEVIFQLGFLT